MVQQVVEGTQLRAGGTNREILKQKISNIILSQSLEWEYILFSDELKELLQVDFSSTKSNFKLKSTWETPVYHVSVNVQTLGFDFYSFSFKKFKYARSLEFYCKI